MLNEIQCAADAGGNTGIAECYLDPKYMVGMLIGPKNMTFDSTATATREAFMLEVETRTLAAAASRVYPLGNFTGFVDSSSEAAKQTFIYGSIAIANEGKYDWTFQYQTGGACLNKALRKFNKGSYSVLFFDANGVVFGYKDGTDLKGIPLELLYAPKLKINDYANTTLYAIETVFDPIYLNDKIGFFQGDVTELKAVGGINDIALKATRATAVVTATAKTGCSGTDVYDLYSTELAVVGAWTARNAATGALITITSVAVDASAKGWTITLDNVDTDYTTGAVIISLATPSALDALDVSKYESNTVSIAA